MSELKYMDLSLDAILKNIEVCKSVIEDQEDVIKEFCDIILSASNKRVLKRSRVNIYLVGLGDSDFVAKAFAMRLMHLGFFVYVFGEAILPPVHDDDIIIIISKSGKSNSIVQIVENSKINDVKFLAVCGDAESELAKKSDACIAIDTLPQLLVRLEDKDVGEFMESLPGSLINFEMDNIRPKIESLPKRNVSLDDKELRENIENLPPEISGISNIYRPLELVLTGTSFEISALILLDSIIIRLMRDLNLREDDLIEYHDVLSSTIKPSKLPETKETSDISMESKLIPGVGRVPFPAYRGDDPYIFVSYAHKDSDRVFKDINYFHNMGYNIWYDEGIAPGNEWPEEIENALKNCSLFVVFITPNAVDSQNVRNEINYALHKKINFIAIYLEETKLIAGLDLQLQAIQGILKYNMDDEEYIYKCTSAFERFGFKISENPDDGKVEIKKEKSFMDIGRDDVIDVNVEDDSIDKCNVLSLNEILKNVNNAKSIIPTQEKSISKFRDIIIRARTKRVQKERKTTIFISGAGRSGLVAKVFAKRLMHLGFHVFVFGESIVPPVNDGDVIIIISKSGKSNMVTKIIEESKLRNVKILSVCGSDDCELSGMSDAQLVIDSLPQKYFDLREDEVYDDMLRALPDKLAQLHTKNAPLELILMGTAFEISSCVVLEALVVELMQKLNLREKDLNAYHDILSSSI